MKLTPAFDSLFQTKWLPSKDSNLEREIQNLRIDVRSSFSMFVLMLTEPSKFKP